MRPLESHPRISNTWTLVNTCKYEGPQLHQFVENYVKGCAKCQENKVNTHMKRAPLAPLRHPCGTRTIPIHLHGSIITDLPPSPTNMMRYLTIVDQGCSKSCRNSYPAIRHIDGQGVAQLYFRHLFPWFGTPKRNHIRSRSPDSHRTSRKAICKALKVQQKPSSTAFHPRTDGQTEKEMNQWIEGYLRQIRRKDAKITADSLLPIAEFAHNSWKHEHTKHSPHELIVESIPTASFDTPEDPVPAAQDRLQELIKTRQDSTK